MGGIQFEEEVLNRKLEDYYERISEDHDVEKYTNKILDALKKTCD